MAKPNVPEETAVADGAPDASSEMLSVNDFCTRLSETVRRPELIGAFAHVQQKQGIVSDTPEAFRARFDAFINQPV